MRLSHLRLVSINLRRHRVRTLIGASGVALGVAAMFSVVAVVRGAIGMFEKILAHDSEMLVFERSVSDLFFSAVDDEDLATIRSMPEVEYAYPVLFGLVSAEGHPVVTCFGLTDEDPRLAVAEWTSGDRSAFGARPNGVVLGTRASEFLAAVVGDRIRLGNTQYEVAAVIHTDNGFEDGGVFLPLSTAREHFHRGDVSSIVTVKLRETSQVEAFRHRVETEVPYLTALENSEFNRGYSQFRILRATGWAVGTAAFLLGGLGVANTMVLSVFVRIRELAVLKSCGFSHGQVGALIVAESLVVTVVGAAAGLTIGVACTALLARVPWLQGYVHTSIEPAVLLAIVVVACVTGILGAAYPARFAMKIEAARALRFE
jgi:putative ABC transport system permease protein